MPEQAQEILEQASALTHSERADLAEHLPESLHSRRSMQAVLTGSSRASFRRTEPGLTSSEKAEVSSDSCFENT